MKKLLLSVLLFISISLKAQDKFHVYKQDILKENPYLGKYETTNSITYVNFYITFDLIRDIVVITEGSKTTNNYIKNIIDMGDNYVKVICTNDLVFILGANSNGILSFMNSDSQFIYKYYTD